jgi:hypothetical protein
VLARQQETSAEQHATGADIIQGRQQERATSINHGGTLNKVL